MATSRSSRCIVPLDSASCELSRKLRHTAVGLIVYVAWNTRLDKEESIVISATLNGIELPATDLAATKTFYEANLGWSFTDYGPTYAAARVSGMEIGFNTEATVGAAQPNGAQNPTGLMMLLQTDDLEAAHSSLGDGGGVILTTPFDFPGGRRLHFRDPSGNVLGIYQAASE